MTTKLRGVEDEFKIKERVMFTQIGKVFEVPATIVGFSPRNYLILIDGIKDPRWIARRESKLRRVGVVRDDD